MGYTVIIAEKPSVAGSIAHVIGAKTSHREGPCGYLEGNGYRVTWAFGHLVGLKSPEEMGFDATTIPMIPDVWQTKVLGKKGKDGKIQPDPIINKQMSTLKFLFEGADKIIVATDAGREGELIFRYIYEYLKCRTPFDRLWISSLTDEAIHKGMNEIQPGRNYDALSAAAHIRSEADWMVGFNASRALRQSANYKGMLSLGRVQTPTLAMICERFIQNRDFKPVPFWKINVDTIKGEIPFTVSSEKKFDTEQEANDSVNKIKNQNTITVNKVEKKRSNVKPPLLYDLTALQRAANGKYGMTADETLKVAQSLYEKKVMTYPRTGSRYIPEDVYKTLPSLIAKFEDDTQFGAYAKSLKGKKLCHKSVNDSKVTDHHALLPTGNKPSDLTASEKKIYALVCGRMLEAFGEDFIADVTNVTLSSAGVIFKAHGSIPVYPGWKAVFGGEEFDETAKKNDDEEEKDIRLPELNEGETLPVKKVESIQKETKPLPIYTDSSLLGEMETCGKKIEDEEMREAMKDVGLGTPATRAATIEALISRGYVNREGKKLLPTSMGLQIYGMVKGRRIADVQTTGEWERDLALVEQGKINPEKFNDGIVQFTKDIISDLQNNCTTISLTKESYKCPICGKQMKAGKFSHWCDENNGGCGMKIPYEMAKKKLPESAIKALIDGKQSAIIKGFTSKTGKKFDASIVLNKEEKKINFVFGDNKSASSSSKIEGLKCPKCGKPLTDKGSMLSCECEFTMWKSICGVSLTESNIRVLLSGQTIHLTGLTSKAGKKFSAGYHFKPGFNETEFVFDNQKK